MLYILYQVLTLNEKLAVKNKLKIEIESRLKLIKSKHQKQETNPGKMVFQ